MLWRNLDLSQISGSELRRMERYQLRSGGTRIPWAMKYRLFKVQSISISCPAYLGYQDLELVRRLLVHNTTLRRLDLEKLYLGTPEAHAAVSRLIDVLPDSLEQISLRQTLIGPGIIKKLLQRHGLRLKRLDLSYTNMTDNTLEDIGIYCCDVLGRLDTLIMDCAFNLSKQGIQRFLVSYCPTTLKRLSFAFTYNLEPPWLTCFIKRQIRYTAAQLSYINIQGSDLFTIKDINQLSTLMRGKCQIRHTAILEDETIEGYKRLLDKLCNGIEYKGEPLMPTMSEELIEI